MKLLKVFKRTNRAFVNDISILNSSFAIENKGDHSPLRDEISQTIKQIAECQPRYIDVINENSALEEIVKNSKLEAVEGNLNLLAQELNQHFPYLRFIEIEIPINGFKLREEIKNKLSSISKLTQKQIDELKQIVEKADENELVLINNDIMILERLSKIEG